MLFFRYCYDYTDVLKFHENALLIQHVSQRRLNILASKLSGYRYDTTSTFTLEVSDLLTW